MISKALTVTRKLVPKKLNLISFKHGLEFELMCM